MENSIPESWKKVLTSEFSLDYWKDLSSFIEDEYINNVCFPVKASIFRALEITPFDSVRVVILGQDPYHTRGAAMGMCFSIPDGIKSQPSLKNIFKELETDIGTSRIKTDLSDWAKQGVFLLNSVLTVREGLPASHQGVGWEKFSDEIIRTISREREHVVFILWGGYALSKASLIDTAKHCIISSPHPSPLSSYRGFFGSRPFSKTNDYLKDVGIPGIVW